MEDIANGPQMNMDRHGFKHQEITEKIIGVFYEVYNELGFGFLESVYREAMRIALGEAGFRVEAEVPVPVSFRGTLVGVFRADIVVNGCIIVERKTAEAISKAHEAQVLHYLRASEMEIGLVMNFGLERIKDGITRIINGYPDGQRERR